jgi:hypothetical protein
MNRPRVAIASALAAVLALASVLVLTGRAGPAGGTGRAASLAVAAAPGAVPADSPAGFWYGTDSWPITIGGKAPYSEPRIGSPYGGYIGMIGSWAVWVRGCGGRLAWSTANSAQANTNYLTYGKGIGTGVYWFMAGPGVDPHYNGTTKEAAAWGARQAAQTLGDMAGHRITYPVVWADIELPGIAPAPDNGWNAVYTAPCSGRVKTPFVAASVDRADFDGYRAYLLSHSHYKIGVYSAPSIWASIFGTGSAASIPTTDEWTYTAFTSSLSRLPAGWCLAGTRTCAQFFGGVTSSSPHALMWQWSGGGGSFNGFGDFDQIDKNRQS